MANIGDTVRIARDEYPKLVGFIGRIKKLSADGTTAWVVTGVLDAPMPLKEQG